MNLKKRIHSDFFKHVLTLVLGTGLAQVINFGGIIVLARIYDPWEQAFFALFSSLSIIITSIACLRYEYAIPIPEKEDDAKRIVVLSTYILAGICLLSFVGIAVFHYTCFLNDHQMNMGLYLVPFFTLFAGGTQVFNYWSTRLGSFNKNFLSRVLCAFATVTFSIVFGLITGNAIGLILGAIFGQFVGWLVLAWKAYAQLAPVYRKENAASLFQLAKTYRKFPLYNAPSTIFDILQDYGVVFVMNMYFADVISALYFQSYRLLGAPVGLVGAAIFQVYYPRMARNFSGGGNIRKEMLQIYGLLWVLALPFFLLLFFFTDQIVLLLLGEKWIAAAPIIRIFIPFIALNFLVSPLSGIVLIAGKQKQSFLLSIAGFILKFTSLFIGGVRNDYYLGFALISFSGSLIMIIAMCWYWYIAKTNK